MLLSEKVKAEISTNGVVSKDTMIEIWELSQKVNRTVKEYDISIIHISGNKDHHLVSYCIELELIFQTRDEESMERTRNAKVIT